MTTPRDISSWLPNLIGPLDLQGDGAPVVTRRATLNFVGGSLTDNPTLERTDIVAGVTAAQINLRGTYAARPAAGAMGRLYFCTDSALVFFDDGVVWQPHGLTQAFHAPPAASTLSLLQTGSNGTLVDDRGALLLSATPRITTDDHIIVSSGGGGGANAPFTFTVGFELHMDSQGDIAGGGFVGTWSMAGVCYHVGAGWEGLMAYGTSGAFGLAMQAAATLTASPSTNFTTGTTALRDRMIWLRVVDNGAVNGVTAMRWYYSIDGRNFYQCWRSNRSFSLTSTSAALIINAYNTGVAMRVFDWTLT